MSQTHTRDEGSKVLYAARHGEDRAQTIQNKYGTDDPWTLSSRLNVAIEIDTWKGLPSMSLLGTYATGTITLYKYQIETFADTEEYSTTEVYDVVCAHELAHHLLDPADFGQAERTSLWSRIINSVFSKSSKIGIHELEEVAAHAFAVTLTGVKIRNVSRELAKSDDYNCR